MPCIPESRAVIEVDTALKGQLASFSALQLIRVLIPAAYCDYSVTPHRRCAVFESASV